MRIISECQARREAAIYMRITVVVEAFNQQGRAYAAVAVPTADKI
jgi:hypothetical protein